jgi:hypothetical protein
VQTAASVQLMSAPLQLTAEQAPPPGQVVMHLGSLGKSAGHSESLVHEAPAFLIPPEAPALDAPPALEVPPFEVPACAPPAPCVAPPFAAEAPLPDAPPTAPPPLPFGSETVPGSLEHAPSTNDGPTMAASKHLTAS